jgi:hypothetical protein
MSSKRAVHRSRDRSSIGGKVCPRQPTEQRSEHPAVRLSGDNEVDSIEVDIESQQDQVQLPEIQVEDLTRSPTRSAQRYRGTKSRRVARLISQVGRDSPLGRSRPRANDESLDHHGYV